MAAIESTVPPVAPAFRANAEVPARRSTQEPRSASPRNIAAAAARKAREPVSAQRIAREPAAMARVSRDAAQRRAAETMQAARAADRAQSARAAAVETAAEDRARRATEPSAADDRTQRAAEPSAADDRIRRAAERNAADDRTRRAADRRDREPPTPSAPFMAQQIAQEMPSLDRRPEPRAAESARRTLERNQSAAANEADRRARFDMTA